MNFSRFTVTKRQKEIAAAAASNSLAAAARNLGVSPARVRTVADEVEKRVRRAGEAEAEAQLPIRDRRVALVPLPARISNCLTAAGFATIGAVADAPREDLLALENFGPRSLREFERFLAVEGSKDA